MSNVVSFAASASAKAKMKKAITKGQTTAKTATTPAGKQKIAATIKQKIKAAEQTQAKLTAPGAIARCRHIAGGDLRAAVLLYRIAGLWDAINPKMRLPGGNREYLAMTQAEWATVAGLSESECRKYAIKRLQSCASHIVQFEVHGRGAKKKTWVHFDKAAYRAALDEAGYELKVAANEGLPGYL
ncbi:hypothetical protein GCM10007897_29000 [Sphingobium jiangsuense]|uniref:Uncharacterized protein n=1 Tax=Sphingobium jiangsuense TaxID=870476 RepID=A0A7W6BD20_9SPHN|nr:hypothetical protein [Sphingobium jiangsuense]MBB3924616.1 hypothetical protein [Sphingobium jiangsuense]GLT01506.1 hypothetical protein GCM10007897_29000 [Sphingobium jiangsuense]